MKHKKKENIKAKKRKQKEETQKWCDELLKKNYSKAQHKIASEKLSLAIKEGIWP